MKLRTSLAALAALIVASAASAVSLDATFNWTGDAGYRAEITFDFDPSVSIVGGPLYSWNDPAAGMVELRYSFFDTSNTLLDTDLNVFAGTVAYPWFSFEFEPSKRDFLVGSRFDIGWDPDFWLYAKIAPNSETVFVLLRQATLEEREAGSGSVFILDSGNTYSITVRNSVPDSGSFAACAGAFLLMFCIVRRKPRMS